MRLDEFQERAVSAPGHALVVAGPGAGKTRTLLARAARLLEEGLSPNRLYLLTFTTKTARELRERLWTLGLPEVRVETFHALAYRLARDLGHCPVLEKDEDYEKLFELTSGHPLFQEEIHLLVDEFQDLSPELVSFLRGFERATFFLVGDPAQAIYGFRGASPELALEFARQLPGLEVIELRRSYRVPREILAVAEGLRDDLGLGLSSLEALNAGGQIEGFLFKNQEEEARWVARFLSEALGGLQMERSSLGLAPGEIAILSRVRHLFAPLKKALRAEGIPVLEAKEREEEKKRILEELLSEAERQRDLFSVVSFLESLGVEETWRKEIEEFISLSRDLEEFCFHLRLLLWERTVQVTQEAVNLMTIHEAKGLEFPLVLLLGAEEGLLPFELMPDTQEEEERRLTYVALTRSSSRLVFTVTEKRFLFGRRLPGKVSRYLAHLPLAVSCKKKTRRRPRQKTLF